MKKIITSVVLLAACFSFVGCNRVKPKQIEKAGKTLIKEYKAMNESEAMRYFRTVNKLQRLEDIYNSYSRCSQCDGYGVVYAVNEYGYLNCDNYGNPYVYTCPQCGGSGKSN